MCNLPKDSAWGEAVQQIQNETVLAVLCFDARAVTAQVSYRSQDLARLTLPCAQNTLIQLIQSLKDSALSDANLGVSANALIQDKDTCNECAFKADDSKSAGLVLRADFASISPEIIQVILIAAQSAPSVATNAAELLAPEAGTSFQISMIEAKFDRLWGAFESYPYPLALFDKDKCLVACNTAYKTSMSREPDKIVPGMPLAEIARIALDCNLLVPVAGDVSSSVDAYMDMADPFTPFLDVEFTGDVHHRVCRSVTPLGDTLITRLDSTALVRARKAAETSHNRLLSALNAYPFPFAIYDEQDCIVVWNKAYQNSMTKLDDFLDVGMHRTVIAEHAIRAGLIRDAVGKEDLWSSTEHQDQDVRKPVQDLELSGDTHQRLYRTRAPNGDLVMLRVDITELIRKKREVEAYAKKLEIANKKISQQNNEDQLTGLANRRKLSARLKEFSKEAQGRDCYRFAIAIDLDHFKLINDSLGHAAGDEVLAAVGKILLEEADSTDLVARVGGDEYVIIGTQSALAERATTLATSILARFTQPVSLQSGNCRIGVSIGVASEPFSPLADLTVHADVALIQAKSGGRGRIGHFEQEDLNLIHQKRAIEVDFERGLRRSEFEPYYQPQIDAHSGELVGLEVLARWNHPSLGVTRPSYFLAQAEEMGLLGRLDDQIFERTMQDTAIWLQHASFPPRLAFNVSADRILTKTDSIVDRTRDYPGGISLELLETVFVEEEDESFFQSVQRVREAGIDIEIDDFGSGRTSILSLLKLSPKAIKIDRRIIKRLGVESNAREMLQLIVQIGRVMNVRIVAEGVETEHHRAMLRDLGCDVLQGYYLGAPMSLTALTEYLQRGSIKQVAHPF